MQELRFVAVSEDGRYAVLAVPGRSARFTLPIDERLRAVALGQTSRLAQYEIEVESPLRPKEIQARIRAGETVEEIADAAGIAVERVRWFEAPILAERAYAADQAQLASVRRQGDATPGPRLGEIVTERLKVFGADPEDAQWDAKKLGDGSWQVQLTFISGGRLHTAEWIFDPRRRHVLPADDNAARMSLPGTEPPQPAAPAPGEATVTHLAPRLSSASGQGAPGHAAPGHAGPGQSRVRSAGDGTSGFGRRRATARWAATGRRGPGMSGRALGGRRSPNPRSPNTTPPNQSVPKHSVPNRRLPSPARPRLRPPWHFCAERSRGQSGHGSRAGIEDRARTPAGTNLSSRRRTPARTQGSAGASLPRRRRNLGPHGTLGRRRNPGPRRLVRKRPQRRSRVPRTPPLRRLPPGLRLRPLRLRLPPRWPLPHPAAPAEPAGEQAARQGRKAARGKRSSVPSWDEIMFGSSRQRD